MSYRAEIVVRGFGSLAQHDENRRCGLKVCDLVLLDVLEKCLVSECFHHIDWDVEFDGHAHTPQLTIGVIKWKEA